MNFDERMQATQERIDERAARGFVIQDGCHNCRHGEGDGDPECPTLYCILDAPPRPIRNAGMSIEEADVFYEALMLWEAGRDVPPAGKCDSYERREPESEENQ